MTGYDYDLCVIGGGINGAGIARDAAGRGLSVLLLEARDLAQATSSASTKLIHGGLRYLEFLEFRLVRDSLREREVLMGIAPHAIKPMDFILPHVRGRRPLWLIKLGMFLYDHLAPRRLLPASYEIDFHADWRGRPLVSTYEKGFCYADCWVDDSRLVALNAMDAAARGAKILTQHRCTKIAPAPEGWHVEYQGVDGERGAAKVSMVVNAAGPWVNDVIGLTDFSSALSRPPRVRLVKGSHIIVNRAYEGEQAYVLQQPDKRIVFAIPYEKDYTLIGTTEEAFEGDSYDPRISDAEMDYLCGAFSTHFKKDITREDVLWTYSGVRPLFDDESDDNRKVSRDYMLYTHPGTAAPFLSVFGGKLTTYRVLAEQVMNRLLHLDNRYSPSWTGEAPLPGGDFPGGDFAAFFEAKREEYPWLPADLAERMARAYGTRMDRILSGARSVADLGRDFGAGLYENEVNYLIRCEFARAYDDVLWRRSKVGMHMTDAQIGAFEAAFQALLHEVLSR